jgi:ABC-type multidrug transport system fused ATPase/permease subunit
MKKWLFLLSLILVSTLVISSSSEPSLNLPGSGDDAEDIKEKVEKINIIDDDGKIDYGKFDPYKTKAEERIEKINSWLDNNVGWLRFIFHMKPEISWLFFIEVFIILWFFAAFVMNADGLWFFIEDKTKSQVFGLGLFAILLIARLYYGLALLIYTWLNYLFIVLASMALWVGLIFILICIIGFFFGFGFLERALLSLARYKQIKQDKIEKLRMKNNNEAIETMVKQLEQ